MMPHVEQSRTDKQSGQESNRYRKAADRPNFCSSGATVGSKTSLTETATICIERN